MSKTLIKLQDEAWLLQCSMSWVLATHILKTNKPLKNTPTCAIHVFCFA